MKQEDIEESHQAGAVIADDGEIPPMVLDLGSYRAGNLDEGLLGMMGAWIKDIMSAMFRGSSLPIKIKGSPSQIDSFAKALSREKRYLEAFSEYGLDNPRTYRSKAELDAATAKFTRATGIPWAFSD